MYKQIARLFTEASQMNPEDADVHIVLGVLFNLSREFDRAMTSFQTALQLKPNDYSLWNKLGATQANSVQSSVAISAYQQVNCSMHRYQHFSKYHCFCFFLTVVLCFFFWYGQALDLKPNYVRAWANMGISYANQVGVRVKSKYLIVLHWN